MMNKTYGHMPLEQPISMKIADIKDEAENIKTFTFENPNFKAAPGQFVMVWIPRKNMKPFGVSYQEDGKFSVTVCRVGDFTEELFNKKVGDYVGVQGPHGTGFIQGKKNAVLVAGGYGAAPLAFLADELNKSGAKVTFIIGARNKDAILYKERFEKSNVDFRICTDDGSCGKEGFTTDELKDVIANDDSIDMIYTVGPEIMMKKVIEISDEHDIECQASLERYMKCGFGICGQCTCDDSGVRVCKAGPVFNKKFIQEHVQEFGKYHRDGTGNKS